MATTRSKARAAELAASRHPQAAEAFKEGLGSVLRQWTALELAVFHQWGGPTSRQRADALAQELLDMYLGPDKIYKDDVSLVLEDYLETNFSTICEDGSPDDLGELLCTMWRQCCEGNFSMVTDILAKEYVRHEMVSRSQGLAGGDAIDEEDEEGDDAIPTDEANDQVERLARQALQQAAGSDAQMDTIQEREEEEQEAPPLVDADGFQTVTRGRKAKSRGAKPYKV